MPNINRPSEFFIKKGDLLPVLTRTLRLDGTPIDLTGVTGVDFHMRARGSTAAVVDAAAAVDNSTGGVVSYNWAAGDTDVAGDYEGEFEIEFSTGVFQTVPNDSEILIYIRSDVA